jgi:hypothetical protein
MFYEHTLYSLHPPTKTGMFLPILLLLLLLLLLM